MDKKIADRLGTIIKELQNPAVRLSSILADTLVLARETNNHDLEQFCQNEIAGYPSSENFTLITKGSDADVKHRAIRSYISVEEININHPRWAENPRELFEYFRSQPKRFPWFDWLYLKPVSSLEREATEVISRPRTVALHIPGPASMFLPNDPKSKNVIVHSYLEPSAYADVLKNIRDEVTKHVLTLYDARGIDMRMVMIRLEKGEWYFNPQAPIGDAGGFGEVFEGEGQERKQLAIKRLRIDAKNAGYRELSIAREFSGKTVAHIMPVLDAGLDADSDRYYIVMPRADKSLQDEIDAGRLLSEKETAEVLLQIAKGLKEAEAVVHRDIKPANILLHEADWKIADFGIAKFVQETTSDRTLKGYKSDEYAAPELWRMETATHATDIYALGCVAYALLSGFPPFKGADLGRNHMEDSPVRLTGLSPRLEALVLSCLRKNPAGRPPIERVIAVLETVLSGAVTSVGAGADALRKANLYVLDAQLRKDAAAAKQAEDSKKYEQLKDYAYASLQEIARSLAERIQQEAGTAKVEIGIPSRRSVATITMGQAQLSIRLEDRRSSLPIEMQNSKWKVIYIGEIVLVQEDPKHIWSATLLFADKNNNNQFRWYEICFFAMHGRRSDSGSEPFACSDLSDVDKCLTMVHNLGIAFGPKAIDDEDLIDFCDRWEILLAKAAMGQIRPPTRFPLEGTPQDW